MEDNELTNLISFKSDSKAQFCFAQYLIKGTLRWTC